VGTRPVDRDVARRRDDLLDIPVGTERLISQLAKAADRVREAVGRMTRALRIDVRTDLSASERKLIIASLNPLADVDLKSGTVRWADEVIRNLTLPQIAERMAPTLRITPPQRHPRNTSPEEIASFYAPAVAFISSTDGAIGSGALISSDGLVLTAAHTLRSEPIHVIFPGSNDTRRFPARLVFVNDSHDVALLRVVGYRSDRWFEVALSGSTTAGEPVVALGNPAITGGGGPALSAISSGIIARPYDPSRSDGFADLVADVAVASGSSGGPLVSRKTGMIVGVVTAVVSPSISKDFATSGYWAVAAPSSELGKWLGIAYGP
jgi:S1-C subfamily serine protease